jgi:hypothetical protein
MKVAMLDPYQYEALSGLRNIRILLLRPSLFEARQLCCSLQQVCIDDYEKNITQLPYEALSYVWGARQGIIPITCEGRPLLVTPNCASALQHLRLKFKNRVIWIDAICINQHSMKEKAQQIPLMGDIYYTARRTIIWIRPGLPGDTKTLRRATILGNLVRIRCVPDRDPLSERGKYWIKKLFCTFGPSFHVTNDQCD